MATVKRWLQRKADELDPYRGLPLVYTVTTPRGTSGPYILNP
jgi:hypothetical protein